MNAEETVRKMFASADIHVNGTRPGDITVKYDKFYSRLLGNGSLGFGESYMDGWWECEHIDVLFYKICQSELHKKVPKTFSLLYLFIQAKFTNMQSKAKSSKVIEQHYDIDNELYTLMLDKNMQYTCAYWKDAKTLDQAQINKLQLLCKKLHLKKGMTVLDLGSGFGGLAKFMAKEYGCSVVAYNISKEQTAYAREHCKGLPVRFEQKDYREAAHETERFDRVVSVGLCEHIGSKNYRNFFRIAHDCLKNDGLFLMHTIGANNTSSMTADPWIEKYIFPNGALPSVKQISAAAEDIFILEDWHSFGQYYDTTLTAWCKNFDASWPILSSTHNDRFRRMWRYYLLSCAGLFRARQTQLWQVVFSKKGVVGGYESVR